jgi:hypothetical protein
MELERILIIIMSKSGFKDEVLIKSIVGVVVKHVTIIVHMLQLQQQLIHKWNIGIRLTLLPLIEWRPPFFYIVNYANLHRKGGLN